MSNGPINFADALELEASEVTRPPVLPEGVYRARVTGPGVIGTNDRIGQRDGSIHDSVTFNCQPLEAIAVNEDDLAEYGDISGGFFRVEFTGKQGDAADQSRMRWGIVKFLTKDCGMESASLRELIDSARGSEFQVTLTHSASKRDPEIVFVNARGTAPVA